MANKSTKANIKFGSINIGGMSSRSQFCLNNYVADMRFDVICVQETGSCDPEKLELHNMIHTTDVNEAANKGAALYVSNRHSLTKLNEISKLSTNIDSCWALVIIDNQRFIIGSIYVKHKYKPAFREIMIMLKAAEKRKVELKAKGILLFGDYNARHLSWGDFLNDDYGNKLVELLDHSLYSISIPKSPTFRCINALYGGSYIDFCIISNSVADLVNICITDDDIELYSGAPKRGHVPVITELVHTNSFRATPYCEKLDIKSINWKCWSESIESDIVENSENMESEENPYALWNILNGIITKATNIHGKMKKCSQYSKPYWTKSLTDCAERLRAARKNFIKRNTPNNLRKLDEAREKFDEERKSVCSEFLLNKVKLMNSSQSLQFWKEFNKIFKKKTLQKIDPLDDGKSGVITDNKAMEDCLFSVFFQAKHLSNGNFDDSFYQEINTLYDNIMKANNIEEELENLPQDLQNLNRPITMKEFSKAIKYTGKSVDTCNFHPVMFRHLGVNAKETLLKLFNLCLSNGIWVWDAAEVIFLRKPGKDSYANPGSYRPICITPYIGKLLEAIIALRIEQLLIQTNQQDPDQEGFSKSKNTIRYLNKLNLEIMADKEKNLTILCIFIDFEKAFDSVWKRGLIVKLNQLGIKGKILELIKNFLFTRKVGLNVNGEKGNPRQTSEYGLPQGSVLSPTLFKIFVGDFVAELENQEQITLFKFADDGTIKISSETSEKCLSALEEVLRCLENWAKKWRMVYNCDRNKTEIICFHNAERNKDLIPEEFQLGGKTIYRVSKTKVLGLTIDENLTYVPHSQQVLKGLHAIWATLCKYSSRHWGFSQRVMLHLVNTLFISKMKYASHIWMNETNTKEIQKLWYHVLKSIIGAVLNVKHCVAEVILGVPPILIQAKTDGIKHFLKLNIYPIPRDRYSELLESNIRDSNTCSLSIINIFKNIFKFLYWKLQNYENQFTAEDKTIIKDNAYDGFFHLSPKSCCYTPKMINKFMENELWKPSLRSQFQIDGYANYPNPLCDPLPMPPNISRETEVMTMSLLYKNNLLNDSLYKLGKVASPLCSLCHREEETATHIIFNCQEIDQALHEEALATFKTANKINDSQILDIDHIGLLNASRYEPFIKSCVKVISSVELRTSIIL